MCAKLFNFFLRFASFDWKFFCCLQEFELLFFNLSSARIFFRNDDNEEDDEENEDAQSAISASSSKRCANEALLMFSD